MLFRCGLLYFSVVFSTITPGTTKARSMAFNTQSLDIFGCRRYTVFGTAGTRYLVLPNSEVFLSPRRRRRSVVVSFFGKYAGPLEAVRAKGITY